MPFFSKISSIFNKNDFSDDLLNKPAKLIDEYHVGMDFSEIASELDIIENKDGRFLNKLIRRKYQFHGIEFSQGFAFDGNNSLSGVILVREFSEEVFSLLFTSFIKEYILLHIDSRGHFFNFNLLYKDASFLKQKLKKDFIHSTIINGIKEKDLKVGFIDKEIIKYVKKFNIKCVTSENIVVHMRPCHRLIDMIVDKSNVLLIKFVHPSHPKSKYIS